MTMLPGRMRLHDANAPAPVTALELFFDLVFAFALSQVSALMVADLGWHGLLRGLLLLALLWWSWVCYAWLGNVIKADEGAGRPAVFAAMAAMFVLALSIPEAFDDAPGGVSGPVVVAVCYFAFRAVHLVLFWVISGADAGLRGQVWRFTPSMLAATGLLLAAAMTSGWLQTGLWAAAVLADYLGNALGGAHGWRLRSTTHFAERHRRIVLVALGVSLAGVGAGAAGNAVSMGVVLTAVLGLTLTGTLWRTYFDATTHQVQRWVAGVPAADRARVARNVYSYLHLPLIAGVVLVALGLRRVFAGAQGGASGSLSDPLPSVALAALVGGVALFLLAAAIAVWQATGRRPIIRTLGAGVLAASAPLAAPLPAVVVLALATVGGGAVVALESWRAGAADAA